MRQSASKLVRALVSLLPFWLFVFFFKLGGGLQYSLLPALGERLMPVWVVGLLVGSIGFVQFLLDLPAGYLLDRIGYKRLLVFGTLMFLLATGSFVLGLTLITYVASVAFSIFGWLFFYPGVNAYLLSIMPAGEAGRVMSLRDTFFSAGIVVASVALPLALLAAPSLVGGALTAAFAFAFVMLSMAPDERRAAPPPVKQSSVRRRIKGFFTLVSKLHPVSSMLLLLNLAGAIFYSVIWFVVPIVIARDVTNTLLGFGLGIFDFSVVVLGFAIGVLADTKYKRLFVFVGLLMFAGFGVLLGYGFGPIFLIFGFFATVGEELAGLSLWSWFDAIDRDKKLDGTFSGVLSMFEDFGWMIGPVIAGFLFDSVGASWTIIVGALPIFVTWALYTATVARLPLPTLQTPHARRGQYRIRHKK